jgi:hypothetical protein
MTDSGKPLKPGITHAISHGDVAQVLVEKQLFGSQALLETRPVLHIANRQSHFTFLDGLAIYVSAVPII